MKFTFTEINGIVVEDESGSVWDIQAASLAANLPMFIESMTQEEIAKAHEIIEGLSK